MVITYYDLSCFKVQSGVQTIIVDTPSTDSDLKPTRLEMENMRFCHLGDFGEKELSAENEEAMGEIDVLFVPVGGKDVIDPEEAVKIISELEPKIAIPMHYAISKTPIKGAKIEEFLKEWGEEKISPEDKFTFKKKDLPEDGTKLVVLSPTISIS